MWLTLHLITESRGVILADVNTDAARTVLPDPEGKGIYINYQNGVLDHYGESFPRWQELVRGAR
jgi:hypothetical protein